MLRSRRLRLRSAGRSSRLTLLSVRPRDSGLYECRHQVHTDQLTVTVLTTADQSPPRSGNSTVVVVTSFTLIIIILARCAQSANLRQRSCSVAVERAWRPLASQRMSYHDLSGNVEGSGKLIVDPHLIRIPINTKIQSLLEGQPLPVHCMISRQGVRDLFCAENDRRNNRQTTRIA